MGSEGAEHSLADVSFVIAARAENAYVIFVKDMFVSTAHVDKTTTQFGRCTVSKALGEAPHDSLQAVVRIRRNIACRSTYTETCKVT